MLAALFQHTLYSKVNCCPISNTCFLGDASESSAHDAEGQAEATAPHTSDAGMSGDADEPSTSGKGAIKDAETIRVPNTKDLKATGVARAAARLLDTDDPDGASAILSVCGLSTSADIKLANCADTAVESDWHLLCNIGH